MGRIYYYHYHPTSDLTDIEEFYSDNPVPYDFDKSGYFSDRIYHSRNTNSRFYIVTFGYEKCWRCPPKARTIDRYTFHFIFDGEGKINNIPMKKGCIYVVPPNVTYVITQNPHNPMTLGWVAIAGKELELVLSILHFPQDFRAEISEEQIEAIEQLFLETVYTKHDIESLPFLMLGNLFRALSMANINYRASHTTVNVHVVRANQFINTHYSEDISVKTVADHLHISESRLRGLFASELGISPHRAIIEKRMSVAKSLMQSEAPPSIQCIAQACGYFDQGAFSKRFQKETGLTPTEYIQSIERDPIKTGQ